MVHQYLMLYKPELATPRRFAAVMAATHACRPHLFDLMLHLVMLRSRGVVSHIVMCTAASNKTQWVAFLKSSLEEWFSAALLAHRHRLGRGVAQPLLPVYDAMFCAEDLEAWQQRHGRSVFHWTGCMIKDMDMVRYGLGLSPDVMVYMIDDRPGGIENGVAVGVMPYKMSIDSDKVLQEHFPLAGAFRMVVHGGRVAYKVAEVDPATRDAALADDDLLRVVQLLFKLLNLPKP
jgi:hypothetical protein